MESFKVLYRRFLDDARVISQDEGFMQTIEKIFFTKIKSNVQKLYENAPGYYSKITQDKDIFLFYQLWFLTIVIIDHSTEEFLKDFKCKNDLLKWSKSRKDPNIPYFISGPLRNQVVKIDFITHYKNLMDSQNSIEDISQYLQLTGIQNIVIETKDFHDDLLRRPNSFDKLPDQAKSFIINIDSKDTLVSVSNGMTIFDCNRIDFEDVTEINIVPRFKDLQNVRVSQIPTSRIPNKKLEILFNTYSRLGITSLEIERNLFQIDIQSCKNAFLVFDGVYANERNIFSDRSNECFRIEGKFSFDSEKNVYLFTPKNEQVTFRGLETVVRNFNLYVNFPGIGNINSCLQLIVYQDSIWNADIFLQTFSNSSEICRKFILNDSDVVLSNNGYLREVYSDSNSTEVSNDYVFKGNSSISTWDGTLQPTDKNLIYKYYEEIDVFNISLQLSSGQISWTPSKSTYPEIICLTQVTIEISDDFRLVYANTSYDSIDVTFTGNLIILNNEVINNSYATNSEYFFNISKPSPRTIEIYVNNELFATILRTSQGFEGFTQSDSFSGIDGVAIGQWEKTVSFENPSSQSFVGSETRIDLLPYLVMRSDLSDFYEVSEESMTSNQKESCSGVLINGEYFKANEYGIIGFTLYTYNQRKYDTKITQHFLNEGDEVLIFPKIEVTNYEQTDESYIYSYAVYTDEGYFISDTTVSNLIAYFSIIPGDQSLLVAVDVMTSTTKILSRKPNGYYELYNFNKYGIIGSIYYNLQKNSSFNVIDVSKLFVKKLIIEERNVQFIKWPIPLPTNNSKDFIETIEKELEEYSKVEPIKIMNSSLILNSNCIHRYSRTYGSYPMISTTEKLCTNKEYILNDSTKGLILKNGDYYTFCNNFTMNYNDKLVFKIYSSMFRVSMKFD